jgi:hypothetical protein
VQFISGFGSTIAVIGIYHEDQPLCIGKIVSPERPNLVLFHMILHTHKHTHTHTCIV